MGEEQPGGSTAGISDNGSHHGYQLDAFHWTDEGISHTAAEGQHDRWAKALVEVIDRTTGKVVPVENWFYDEATGEVIIKSIPYHQ